MKSDLYRLERIVEIGRQLIELLDDTELSGAALSADYRLQWLVSTPLYNIGEQVNCLSAAFVSEHPDQPWSSIAGLRHRLVHDYEGTNWDLIAAILSDEIRPFIKRAAELLAEMRQG